MTEWTELKQRVLLDALKRIDNLGVQYKIIAPDGAEYGTLVVAPPEVKKKKSASKYPHGEMKTYVSSMIGGMQPGDEMFVPVGKYDLKSVQSALATYAFVNWGAGNYVTAQERVRGGVTILRVV
jgi:hypothetical protein